MMANDKRSFIMYNDYAEHIKLLTMTERGQLLTAIYEYVETGSMNFHLKGSVAMAFSFIKSNLDRDREKYSAVCEQNAINGKKGGRPRKTEKCAKTERFFEKPKKADNDIDTDNDTDTDIDIGIGIGGDKEMDACEASVPPPPNAPLTQKEGVNFKEVTRRSGEYRYFPSGSYACPCARVHITTLFHLKAYIFQKARPLGERAPKATKRVFFLFLNILYANVGVPPFLKGRLM